MFAISKSVLPSYVNQMFSFRPFNETLNLSHQQAHQSFIIQGPPKETFKQSSIYLGPAIWNNFPD